MQSNIVRKLLYLFIFILSLNIFLLEKSSSAPTIFDGTLIFYNTHTKETLNIKYLDEFGQIDQAAKEKINWILRSFDDNKILDIDNQLIMNLDQIQDYFGQDKTIEIISGYRSPYYNAKLRAKSNGVASHSLHLKGKALDFRITYIPLKTLDKYALSLRKGGVGYYSSSNFIHIDTGPTRKWGSRNYSS